MLGMETAKKGQRAFWRRVRALLAFPSPELGIPAEASRWAAGNGARLLSSGETDGPPGASQVVFQTICGRNLARRVWQASCRRADGAGPRQRKRLPLAGHPSAEGYGGTSGWGWTWDGRLPSSEDETPLLGDSACSVPPSVPANKSTAPT